MGSYRSRLKIIADVLGVARGGARKTQIMYQANLSYRLLTRYLKDVVDMGLVRMQDEGIYELTEKGIGFLSEFKGYHERRVEVEEQLNDMEDARMKLENRFLNAKGVDADLKSPSSQKGERTRSQAYD